MQNAKRMLRQRAQSNIFIKDTFIPIANRESLIKCKEP